MNPKLIIASAVLDLILGDPYNSFHPVKLMGKIIYFEEKLAFRKKRSDGLLKIYGLLIVIFNISISYFPLYFLLKLLDDFSLISITIQIYLGYKCLAARSLSYESKKVLQALSRSLKEGRDRLSHIVGRDTKNLDYEGIIRANIETVAENTGDGVIAPLFYMFILGIPGGLMYKMVNTMDSILGYKNEKYKDLGYFPAKVDDLFNYLPSRITALLFLLAASFRFDLGRGIQILIRDRRNHLSPNAGYPEAAVAGLLGLSLGGPSYYKDRLVYKPTIGDDLARPSQEKLLNSIYLMYMAELIFIIIYWLVYKILK